MPNPAQPLDTLGGAIRAARLKAKVTQKDLAAAAGVTEQYISIIENRGAGSAAPETIVKIAERLGVNARRLLKLAAPKSVRDWQDAIEGRKAS